MKRNQTTNHQKEIKKILSSTKQNSKTGLNLKTAKRNRLQMVSLLPSAQPIGREGITLSMILNKGVCCG